MNIHVIGQAKKGAFLEAYRRVAVISVAARVSGISRQSHYFWLDRDPEYAKEFQEAKREAAQVLEDEAVRRATEGVLRPVFYQGKRCGVVREYSDLLLIFLMKGAMPQKYKDRSEVTGAEGGTLLEGLKVVYIESDGDGRECGVRPGDKAE